MSLRYCMERNQRCIKGADGEVKATTSCWWNAEAKTFVLNSVLFSEFSRWIIIWLCVTGTGNYRIHKFDWLKSILTAPSHVDGLHFAAKRSKTKIKKYWLFFHGGAKRPNEEKKNEEDKQTVTDLGSTHRHSQAKSQLLLECSSIFLAIALRKCTTFIKRKNSEFRSEKVTRYWHITQ